MSESYASNPALAMALRRGRLSDQLLADSLKPRNVGGHAGGLAQMGTALINGYFAGQDDRRVEDLLKRQQDARAQAMAQMLAGPAAPAAAPVAPAAPAEMPAPQEEPAAPAASPARVTAAPVPPPDLMPHFEAASAETGIPVPVLVATARQESNFNPQARGRAGEIGVMQIMPSTARQPGFGVAGVDPAVLNDPGENIRFGARYLRARAGANADFNDPQALALALRNYNGGGDPNYVENVTRWMPQDLATPAALNPAQVAQAPAPQAPGMGQPAPAMPQGGQRGAGDTVTIGGRSFSMPAIMQAMTDPDPQVAQTARTLFAAAQSQERESFSAPQAVRRNGEDVMIQFGNRGTERVVPGAQPARERSQADRDRVRYAELAGRQDSLSQAERIELEAVAKAVFGADNVQVGPSGVAVLPAPRPGLNSRDAMPASQGAPADGLARPANDAMAGTVAPTQRAPQQVALPDGRTAQYIPAEQPPAQPPATMASAMLNNAASLRNARIALDLVNQRPQSFGLAAGVQNMVPGVLERTDPDGTQARAAVANLGSLVIHDRSGAAVTAAEFPRLRPFIPQVSDPPDVVKTKLASFVREYEDMLKDQYSAFGPSSGYRQLAPIEEILRPAGGRSGAAPGGGDMPLVQNPADAQRLPPGTRFRTPDGRVLEVPRQ
jgi:soluble lytic murein transglycosylase-like protein